MARRIDIRVGALLLIFSFFARIFLRREKLLFSFFFAFFLASFSVVLLSLGTKLSLIPVQIHFDTNEAWNGFHVMRLAQHLPLYLPHGALITNNYPPLSFYLYDWLHALPYFKDVEIITFGRGEAASFCALSGFLLAFLSLKTAQFLNLKYAWFCGVISLLLFAFLSAGLFSRYFAMFDPQWSGEAFMLLGLSFFVSFKGRLALFPTAFCFLLAGLIKHNLVTAPLAVTLWLFLRDRSLFWSWCVVSGGGGGAVLLGCYAFFGHDLFENVLGYELGARIHSLSHAVSSMGRIYPLIIFLVGIVWLSFGALKSVLLDKSPFWSFWLIFAGLGFVIGCLASTSPLCDANVYFDFALSVCLLSAPVFVLVFFDFALETQAEKAQILQKKFHFRRFVQAFLLLGMVLLCASVFSANSFKLKRHLEADKAQEAQVVSTLKKYLVEDRQIACWEALDCFWAGGDFLMDSTWLSSLPVAHLVSLLEQHHIHALVGNREIPLMQYIAFLGAEPHAVGERTLYFLSDLSEKSLRAGNTVGH